MNLYMLVKCPHLHGVFVYDAMNVLLYNPPDVFRSELKGVGVNRYVGWTLDTEVCKLVYDEVAADVVGKL